MSYPEKFFAALKAFSPDDSSDVANWEKAGSDSEAGMAYFEMRHPGKVPPPWTNECICEHDIEKNCFIVSKLDSNIMLVVGSECIKKFLRPEDRGKKCFNCNAPHRNRTDNLCNECRKPECARCGNRFEKKRGEIYCTTCRYRCRTCKQFCNADEAYCDEHKPLCPECGAKMSFNSARCDTCYYQTIRFGKYTGKTFAAVRLDDPSYCDWVLREKPKRGTDFYWYLKKYQTPKALPEQKAPPDDFW